MVSSCSEKLLQRLAQVASGGIHGLAAGGLWPRALRGLLPTAEALQRGALGDQLAPLASTSATLRAPAGGGHCGALKGLGA